jgi:hypothetical protein
MEALTKAHKSEAIFAHLPEVGRRKPTRRAKASVLDFRYP